MEITNPNTATKEALKALHELEDQFTHWRQNKSSVRESIPLDLLQSAKSLSHHVGQKVIRDRLGISNAQLKRGSQIDQHLQDNQASFVKAESIKPTGQPWHIEVHMPTGSVVTIAGLKSNPVVYVSQLLEQAHDCA